MAAYAPITYKKSEASALFDIPFDYLSQKFIQVFVSDALQAYGTDYDFLDKSRVRFLRGNIAAGTSVTIQRNTDASSRLVSWRDASVLRATDMELSQLQLLHIAEEAYVTAKLSMGLDSKFNWNALGRCITNLAEPLEDRDAASASWVRKLISGLIETGQGPINTAANVLFTDAGGATGNLQQIGKAVTTLANTSKWYTRRVMDPIFTGDDALSPIYPGAERAVQGLVVLDTPSGTKLFMISRSVGDTSGANERCRIVEFNYEVTNGRSTHVQFTEELAVGHGEALGGYVDGSGQVWLYTTQSNLDGVFTGTNARKGFSRIKYKGVLTTQSDVTSYQLFGLNGTTHELAEYNNGSVGLSEDSSKILIVADSQKEQTAPTLFIYDRVEVESSVNPLLVRPLNRFRLRPGGSEGYGRVGVAADDQGIYVIFGTAPFSEHGVVVYDWSGRFIRDIPLDDARGEYTYDQLMGAGGLTPNVFELEGAALYRNKLHFVCLEAWRNGGDVVSFAYNETSANFACIGNGVVGIYPYDRTAWVPTNRPASGAFNPTATYYRGPAVTTYRKRVYAISAKQEAGYVPNTGKFLQRSAGGVHAGRNSFNAITYNYPGIFRVLGWNETTKSFKRTMEYNSGYLRLWDNSEDGQYPRYGSIRASFSATARFVSVQGYGGDETTGARTVWFGGTDAELPGGVKELTGGSSSVVVRQVDAAGEHLVRNLATVPTVMNVRRVGASGSIMKLQLNSGGDTYGEFFSSTTNFQIVARRGADLCFSNAPDEATGQTIRWRINGTDHSFRPGTDNAYSVGSPSARPSVLYAGSGTINVSDGRLKTTVEKLNSSEISAAVALASEIGSYRFLAEMREKSAIGQEARLHIGMTVQRAIEVMEGYGLDPFKYGFICYDKWEATPQVIRKWDAEYDEEGNQVTEAGEEIVQKAVEAGDRYSFRMDELYAFIAGGQHALITSLNERLLKIENS